MERLFLWALVYCLSQERRCQDIDVLEIFAGVGVPRLALLYTRLVPHAPWWLMELACCCKAVWGEAQRRGLSARGLDLQYSDTNDIGSPSGFMFLGCFCVTGNFSSCLTLQGVTCARACVILDALGTYQACLRVCARMCIPIHVRHMCTYLHVSLDIKLSSTVVDSGTAWFSHPRAKGSSFSFEEMFLYEEVVFMKANGLLEAGPAVPTARPDAWTCGPRSNMLLGYSGLQTFVGNPRNVLQHSMCIRIAAFEVVCWGIWCNCVSCLVRRSSVLVNLSPTKETTISLKYR